MKVCEVKIFGQTYSLRADVDTEEVRRIAELVDARMRDVSSQAPSASALQVAVLAALDLAGERVAEPQQPSLDPEEVKRVEDRLQAMIALLDTVMPENELA